MEDKDNKLYTIKFDTKIGVIQLDDVIEYVFGYKYAFVRTTTRTLSIGRNIIYDAHRWYRNRWVPIKMKKIRKYLEGERGYERT